MTMLERKVTEWPDTTPVTRHPTPAETLADRQGMISDRQWQKNLK